MNMFAHAVNCTCVIIVSSLLSFIVISDATDRCKLMRDSGLLTWLLKHLEESTNQGEALNHLAEVMTVVNSLLLVSVSQRELLFVS